jgi:hypothetical protein
MSKFQLTDTLYDDIQRELNEINEFMEKNPLTVTIKYNTHSIPGGRTYWFVDLGCSFTDNPLYRLHEIVLDKLSKYVHKGAKIYIPPWLSNIPEPKQSRKKESITRYGSANSGLEFDPHITIGTFLKGVTKDIEKSDQFFQMIQSLEISEQTLQFTKLSVRMPRKDGSIIKDSYKIQPKLVLSPNLE